MALRRRWKSRPPSKPKNQKKIFFFAILIFTFFSIQSFVYIERNLRPPLLHAASMRITQMATQAINSAINERISSEAALDKLIEWRTDQYGKTQGFMLNYAEHMRISSETVRVVQNTLDSISEIPEHIPIGMAFDSTILASYGPEVPVRLIPLGAVKVELNTRERDAGINMVLVEVFIRVTAEVSIIIPFDVASEVVRTEIPISYLLVVGDVPMYYFDNKGNPVGGANNAAPLPNISLPKDLIKPE